MIPPLVASYLGITIYVGGLIFGTTQWRPEFELILQIVVLTTAQALIMVTGAVVVSSQTTSTRASRSEEHTSELQSPDHLVCRLLLEKKKNRSTSCSRR